MSNQKGKKGGKQASPDASKVVVLAANIDQLYVLFNDDITEEKNVRQLISNLVDYSNYIGMNLPRPIFISLNIDEADEFFEQIEVDLTNVVLYVDTKEDSASHNILKQLERKYLVPTQHISTELEACPHELYYDLNKKINLKCGGKNRNNEHSSIPNDTLVVAFQMVVTPKPRKGEADPAIPNVVSFAFNALKVKSDFVSDYAFEAATSLSIQNIGDYIKHILGMFKKNRGFLPEKIIFIRSHVIESLEQQIILDTEVPRIRDACQQFSPEYSPQLAVVNFETNKKFNMYDLLQPPWKYDKFMVVGLPMTPPRIGEFVILRKDFNQSSKNSCAILLNEVDNFFDDGLCTPLAQIISEMCTIAQTGCSKNFPEPVHQAAGYGRRGKRLLEMFKKDNKMSDYMSKTTQQIDWQKITEKLALADTIFAERQIIC
ncbi:hypothetical protein QR680_002835 [Steinernema hermaphroditum]|uniref:Piwi domain-containing protein n=1 Tax=Steinernema hermaphroditum TaxID=289476 RepID=A0AA39H637_9BILA|nr:hypothetical protein QR680_002835 [Steinernema hermaphroditum]